MTPEPVLRLDRATVRYGAVLALDHVNLELQRGEVLALLGDNGAGKSTLVKSIMGGCRLDEGEVWLEGKRIDGHDARERRRMGIETVHQDLALFDNLSATENLFAGRELLWPPGLRGIGIVRRKAMFSRTTAVLEELEVGIADPSAPIGLMSGGQRQAIAVARARTFASKLVLLDEPTAALGVRESGAVLRLIRSLPERGISVIVISHNLEHVAEIADRAVVLRRGRLIGEEVPTAANHNSLVQMIVGGAR